MVASGLPYLLRVHGGGPPGAEDEQAGASVRVQQARTIALAQCVEDAGLIEVDQRSQVFQTVTGGSISLCDGTGRQALKMQNLPAPPVDRPILPRPLPVPSPQTFSTSSSSTSKMAPSWSSFTRTFPSGKLSSSDLS